MMMITPVDPPAIRTLLKCVDKKRTKDVATKKEDEMKTSYGVIATPAWGHQNPDRRERLRTKGRKLRKRETLRSKECHYH